MPMKPNEREYRDLRLEIVQEPEDEKRMIVGGYASTFDHSYLIGYDFDDTKIMEQVEKTAFDTSDMSDVIMQYDHAGRVFARTRNNTLELNVDDIGLGIKAFLGGTELGRQLYEDIQGGYIDRMSFGFIVDRSQDLWTEEAIDGEKVFLRTIRKIDKVFDVSAVSFPANDATAISVRSLIDGVNQQREAERLLKDLEIAKRKMEMKWRLSQ